MKAHYGYEDGSGSFTITIDTDRCNGCEDCVAACPADLLQMIEEDPLEEAQVAAVRQERRNSIAQVCGPCKPSGYEHAELPCVAACEPDAIRHSW